MNDAAIRVEGIGKEYRLGQAQPRYSTLRDVLAGSARRAGRVLASPVRGMRGRQASETFWALRDVSFQVARGEVVGIIGGNGAGKSTLLKILSRITEPTEGDAWIHGRVGSLLEVGTGFHPELTGRENTYLNGAILGMGRREIDAKFDEIVAFAEVEKFIDTPVKHYSSGMYLRLAFAVAAHLEPEILIVDEVLAVGDANFQKKCLGKMSDVAHEGRTVLFVSHNMDAVRRLCTRCVLLERGGVAAEGDTTNVISRYLSRDLGRAGPGIRIDVSTTHRVGSGEVRFRSAWYSSFQDTVGHHAYPSGPLEFVLELVSDAPRSVESMAVSLRAQSGTMLVNADVISLGKSLSLRRGRNTVALRIEEVHLNPGTYIVSLWVGDALDTTLDYVEEAFEIEVVSMNAEGLGVTPGENGVVPCRFDMRMVDRADLPDVTRTTMAVPER